MQINRQERRAKEAKRELSELSGENRIKVEAAHYGRGK
jgi:cell division protein FtsL